MTLENTTRFVNVDGVEARVWEGTTAMGVRVQALVVRVAASAGEDVAEFERDLEETRPPSVEAQAFPAKLRL